MHVAEIPANLARGDNGDHGAVTTAQPIGSCDPGCMITVENLNADRYTYFRIPTTHGAGTWIVSSLENLVVSAATLIRGGYGGRVPLDNGRLAQVRLATFEQDSDLILGVSIWSTSLTKTVRSRCVCKERTVTIPRSRGGHWMRAAHERYDGGDSTVRRQQVAHYALCPFPLRLPAIVYRNDSL
jgi:hypothetical protein